MNRSRKKVAEVKAIQVLNTLRDLKVMVVHPHNQEGEVLIRQLKRIGCQVEAVWPLPTSLSSAADVVFITVQEDELGAIRKLCAGDRYQNPTLIAMVAYEAPTVLQAVIDIHADAVITRPIRSLGVMTNLVAARQVWLREKVHRENSHKLQRKLKSIKKINQAKSMLMNTLGVSEEDAYKTIRDRAMAKRVTIEEMAVSVVNANELLQSLKKAD